MQAVWLYLPCRLNGAINISKAILGLAHTGNRSAYLCGYISNYIGRADVSALSLRIARSRNEWSALTTQESHAFKRVESQ
jgi:hypothetical protein